MFYIIWKARLQRALVVWILDVWIVQLGLASWMNIRFLKLEIVAAWLVHQEDVDNYDVALAINLSALALYNMSQNVLNQPVLGQRTLPELLRICLRGSSSSDPLIYKLHTSAHRCAMGTLHNIMHHPTNRTEFYKVGWERICECTSARTSFWFSWTQYCGSRNNLRGSPGGRTWVDRFVRRFADAGVRQARDFHQQSYCLIFRMHIHTRIILYSR